MTPHGGPGGLILTNPGPFKIPPPPLQAPGFEQLQSHTGLRRDWTHIVAGKFTSSPYSGLLFYEKSSGLVEIRQTDGAGGMSLLGTNRVRPSCTHVVPGFFGPSKLCGVLLYEQAAGFGVFYDTDGQGALIHLADHPEWRHSWTYILAGRFRDLSEGDSWLSDLFFYEGEDGYGETYKLLDFHGNIGIVTMHESLGAGWTHVVAGDFMDSQGSVPIDDLFLYDASAMRCETYLRDSDGGLTSNPDLSVSGLPPATYILPGRFAGYGPTNLLCYDRPTGAAAFMDCGYGWQSVDNYTWAQNWDIVVAGNFWMADPADDHVFIDGGFADLFLYNRADGRGDFYLHEPWNPTPIQPFAGYVSRRSNEAGQQISFHVSSQVGPYTINVYRLGLQEKWMASVENLASPAAFPIGRTAYKTGAHWPATGSLNIPKTWPTGLYVARVQAQSILTEGAGDRPASYARRLVASAGAPTPLDIPFVVRAAAGNRKRILVAISDTTYEAYNFWGGRSSYTYGREGGFVFTSPQTTSFIGPYACRVSFLRGTAGNFPEYDKKWQYWELPLLKWLERQSIAVDVCAESDLHFHTDLLDGYQLLVIVGHSEYWSGPMRDRVEDFVKQGGNVAIFAGNVCWWQVRFEDDGDTMVCYKVSEFDAASQSPASLSLTTINWYEPDLSRPDTRFSGVSLGGTPNPVTDHLEFVVSDASQWVFANTGLKNGDRFGLYYLIAPVNPAMGLMASIVGPETDHWVPSSPPGFQRLACVHDAGGNEIATMGMFSPINGLDQQRGVVFTAATINWSLGLTLDGCSNPMDIITRNILIRLG